ncbi:LysR family transcriptional regulator [Streptomyces boncukensis]|uniref:LysR family transcriptional regulator n=1 Tax=Streptomyces boncukensis TaxID=2711219 RepID=A0A6G4WS86_9ACTN|nr:LysR family transcriptional regulator [Streptomyces boncukensis]NGO67414.1 LysR family transcriptional regulator [Streptomyces boncukensis]
MELYQLRYFRAVAEAGHMGMAASRLAVSQSAVSRAVAQLEQELGVALFTRRGRVIELNRFGGDFLVTARETLARLDRGAAGVRELAGEDSGSVALGFLHQLGAVTVPELIRRHRERRPGVGYALRQGSGRGVVQDLLDGSTDLCLTVPGLFDPGGAVRWHELFEQPLRLAVPRGHRLARRAPVDFAELADEPVVLLTADHTLRAIFDAACERHGVRPRVAFEGTDVNTLRGLIGAGIGLGLLPEEGPTREVEEVRLADASLVRPIALGWIEDRYMPPSSAAFRETALHSAR